VKQKARKYFMVNIIVSRIVSGLDAANVPAERGRVKDVADKTGYSSGMVSRILAGKVDPAAKFIRAVCSAFNISFNWVIDGVEPVLNPPTSLRQLTAEDLKIQDGDAFDSSMDMHKNNVVYMTGLIRRLNNDEMKLVEEFIFEIFNKRKAK
jgi:transcriptional regulator with XRE-family HTH domain